MSPQINLGKNSFSTLAACGLKLPLSDSDGRSRRADPSASLAALQPSAVVVEQSKRLAAQVRTGDWVETARALHHHRALLRPSLENLLTPPALGRITSACLEETCDDGDELLEGYARRFLTLVGAEPLQTETVALNGIVEHETGRLHLVDPDDPRRSACGHLKGVTASRHALRGHFSYALAGNGRELGIGVCRDCERLAEKEPARFAAALEEPYFSVLETNESFPPVKETEMMLVARAVNDGLERSLAGELPPTGGELRDDMRRGLAQGLGVVAAGRLAERPWPELRRRFFSSRSLRLHGFYQQAYGAGAEQTMTTPSRALLLRVFADAQASEVLVGSLDGPMLYEPEERRARREAVDQYLVVPGLLAHCFPEMLAVIERELEGDCRVLAGLSDDYRERLLDRLDKVWSRAARLVKSSRS